LRSSFRGNSPFPPPDAKTTIRPATPSDKAFIATLSGEVFSSYGPYRATVSQWFESGMTLTLISMAGDKPVGFVMIGTLPADSEGQKRTEILAIALTPEFQGRGIGRDLLQFAQKEAGALGEQTLFLHTARENLAAQKLFLKNGFRPVQSKPRFYPSGQDALMMVNDLGKDQDHKELDSQ